jgi:hypothetical protein
MAVGDVRYLRVGGSPNFSIPGIARSGDPALLAHDLLMVEPVSEKAEYLRTLRLSNIADVCVRERILGLRYKAVSKVRVPVGLQLTYDIGNAVHEFLQNNEKYFGRRFLGNWRCSGCGSVFFGRKPANRCASCGALAEARRYCEYSLRFPGGHPVTGHPDGFLEIAPGDIRIIDFKTINGNDFKALSTPKAAHVIQVNGYMHYMHFVEDIPIKINTSGGFLLYINKQHTTSFPFKAFYVPFDKLYIDVIQAKVSEFKRCLDSDSLPTARKICSESSFTASEANYCPMKKHCMEHFNG